MFAGFLVPGTFFNTERRSCKAACNHKVLTSKCRTRPMPERLAMAFAAAESTCKTSPKFHPDSSAKACTAMPWGNRLDQGHELRLAG